MDGSGLPAIRVGHSLFRLGHSLSGRYGFDECTLDKDLLRIVITLATCAKNNNAADRQGGWVDAAELGVLARNGASAQSTAKRLEVSLAKRASVRKEPRLIEFWQSKPHGQKYRGGRSRGPYRVGPSIDISKFNVPLALAVLSGAIKPHSCSVDLSKNSDPLVEARTLMHEGDFYSSKVIADSLLLQIYQRSSRVRSTSMKDLKYHLAEANLLLATIHLQLGSPQDGVIFAQRAQHLFESLRHPQGLCHSLQAEAHLRGQFGTESQDILAVAVARRAKLRIDNCPKQFRTGLERSICVGTLGLRNSAVHRYKKARRQLTNAKTMAAHSNSKEWAGLWSLRLAHNEITCREGTLRRAEHHITEALELERSMRPPAIACLVRVMAEFSVYSGNTSEAIEWISRAREVGESHGMAHTIKFAEALEKKVVS